jgi:26S proteasome regulatory subunit N10
MMTMAGKRPEIYLTQTNDVGRLLSTIQKMPISGYVDLARAIKIAQLSLKHRQNKNQRQRIVVFVGSPIEGMEDRDMVKLGKQLRKNDVAIDVINFGHEENVPLLKVLVDNCNKGGNSHLIEISYGMNIADSIITSSIVAYDGGFDEQMPAEGAGEGGAQPTTGSGAAAQFAEYGGIDPNQDPELAMAIRISLEEAKIEDNKDGDKTAAAATPGEPQTNKGDVDMKNEDEGAKPEGEVEEDEDDYEKALEEAKLLSMGNRQDEPQPTAGEGQEDKNEQDLDGVINEEFLGELMQDLGVPMSEEALKG